MIKLTKKALAAYEEWVDDAHTWSTLITSNDIVFDRDIPPEALEAARTMNLRAEITSTFWRYLSTTGVSQTYRRTRAVRAWLTTTGDEAFVTLSDYPRSGDVVTLRW